MKRLIYLQFLLLVSLSSFGQGKNVLFHEVDKEIPLNLNDHYALLEVNETYWNLILDTHPTHLEISIPYEGEVLQLSLNEADFMRDLTIRTSSGNDLNYNEVSRSIYYQGTFEGYANSHFALSILNNEIIGIGSIPGKGDLNLGKLENNEEYIFLSEAAIGTDNPFQCNTADDYESEMWEVGHTPRTGKAMKSPGDCVGVYFEVDHDIFLDKGGVVEAADYITALFNEVQFIYSEDGINVYISDIFVWDEVSPYDGITSMSTLLDLFGTETTVWDGDIGHFVSYRGGGGLAWVDILCNAQYYRKAISDINSTFAEVPVFSWSVEVVTHEMGHNLGSPHTHACFWNGTMTAIDGCGPSAGYDEGCDAPLPSSGTVMSYCHLVGGVGIDLALGLGTQPAEHIQDRIAAAACLDGCDLSFVDAAVSDPVIETLFCVGESIEPQITLTNNCEDNLVSVDIAIFIDDALEESMAWSGSISPDGTATVTLPEMTPTEGVHTLRVELSNPNGEEDDVLENNEIEIEFEARAYPNVSVTSYDNISCQGAHDGAINVTVTGGTPAYSYLWSHGIGAVEDPTDLGENTYTLTVTDELGCEVEISQEITEPDALISSANVTNTPACHGDMTGSAEVSASGGTPGYTYSWSSGGTTNTESTLASGDYTVTVTDANGCSNEHSITVDEPEIINATATTSDEVFGEDGAIDVTTSGGTPAYTFLWSNDETSEDISELTAGLYSLTVTDANGCTAEFEFTVSGQVGLNDLSGNPFTIYPNPASTTINISNVQGITINTVRLYNSLGQVIVQNTVSPEKADFMLDVSDFETGIYYIVLDTDNQLYTVKFLIEK